MWDEELAAVLNTEVLRLTLPRAQILFLEEDQQASLRYRYRLPKVIGDLGDRQLSDFQAREEQLNGARDTLEHALALLFVDPTAISGRVTFVSQSTPGGGGVNFLPESLTPANAIAEPTLTTMLAPRRANLAAVAPARTIAATEGSGACLASAGLPSTPAASRGRDRLWRRGSLLAAVLGPRQVIDFLVAAEALYLSDLGPEELGFRLALRAAALSDSQKLGMSRRDVFDLMKSAYRCEARSCTGTCRDPRTSK